MSDLRPPQPPAGYSTGIGSSSFQGTSSSTHSSETVHTANVMEKVEKAKRAARPQPKVDLQNLPDLLTIGEVSSLLRVSPLTIKRWGKRGKLPAIRINSRGDRRYKKQAVLWMLGMTEQ